MSKVTSGFVGTSTTSGTSNPIISGSIGKLPPISGNAVNGTEYEYYREYSGAFSGYERGIARWNSGTSTLERTNVLLSSNSNAAVNWSGAQTTIYLTEQPARAAFRRRRFGGASQSRPIVIVAFGNSNSMSGASGPMPTGVVPPENPDVYLWQAATADTQTASWQNHNPAGASLFSAYRGIGAVRWGNPVTGDDDEKQTSAALTMANEVQLSTGQPVLLIHAWKGGTYSDFYSPAVMGDTDASTNHAAGIWNMWYWVGTAVKAALAAARAGTGLPQAYPDLYYADVVLCDVAAGDCLQNMPAGSGLHTLLTTATPPFDYHYRTQAEVSAIYAANIKDLMDGAADNVTLGGWAKKHYTRWYHMATPHHLPLGEAQYSMLQEFDGNLHMLSAVNELVWEVQTPYGPGNLTASGKDKIGCYDFVHWNNYTHIVNGQTVARMYLEDSAPKVSLPKLRRFTENVDGRGKVLSNVILEQACRPYVTKTADYTFTRADAFIEYTSSTAAPRSLQAFVGAAADKGFLVSVINESSHTITFAAGSGQSVSGSASVLTGTAVSYVYNGSGVWRRVKL